MALTPGDVPARWLAVDPVEMASGIALTIVAAVLIAGITRTVIATTPRCASP